MEKTKRARYWTQRLNKLMADTDDGYAMEKWKRVHRALHDEIHGKSIARKNEAMKQIVDACAPHEV